MKYQSKITVLSLFLIVNLLVNDVSAAVKCKGRPHLLHGSATSCFVEETLRGSDESQSCLTKARNDLNRKCSADECVEVNIKAEDGEFEDDHHADHYIWSFSSCYMEKMNIRVCYPALDLTPTTTTEPPTTQFDNSTTTTQVMTTQEPTTTTTAEATTTTTAETTTTTTAETITTTTAGPTTTGEPTTTTTATTTEMPEKLLGCFTGEVTFAGPTCTDQKKTVQLDSVLHGEQFKFEVEIVGCCDTALCEAGDGVTREFTCNYGMGTDVVDVKCDVGCVTYITVDSDNVETAYHRCLDDEDVPEDSNFRDLAPSNECSGEYSVGTCGDANDEEECIRCCTTNNCNDFTRDNILPVEATTDSAAGIIPSLVLIITAWLLVVKF